MVQGAKDLGVELDKLIEFVAESLYPVASHLGLATGGTSGNEQLKRTLARLNSATI